MIAQPSVHRQVLIHSNTDFLCAHDERPDGSTNEHKKHPRSLSIHQSTHCFVTRLRYYRGYSAEGGGNVLSWRCLTLAAFSAAPQQCARQGGLFRQNRAKVRRNLVFKYYNITLLLHCNSDPIHGGPPGTGDEKRFPDLGCLADGAGARVAADGELEVRQGQSLEGDHLPGNAGVGSVNERLKTITTNAWSENTMKQVAVQYIQTPCHRLYASSRLLRAFARVPLTVRKLGWESSVWIPQNQYAGMTLRAAGDTACTI